ncbi:MAG: CHAT domain-containing protein [Gloeocapsa sp. UFS-A4-WI-NPMV-4B04]|nr:CHAT domain-containing protein [Gloeocapsa sp. UFS-A4-WI-NPMV-4B04]
MVPDTGTAQLPKVEVVITAPGFSVDSRTKILQIEREKTSEVPFALTPLKLGYHKITVRFCQVENSSILGTLERNVFVSEQTASVEVPQSNEPTDIDTRATTVTAPDLELFVHLSFDRRTLSFELFSREHHRIPFGEISLAVSPLEEMKAIYSEMDVMAARVPNTSDGKTNAEKQLARRGMELWDKFIPELLKQEYWKFKSRVKSILVTSQEPWIPWEMLKPHRYNDKGEREVDLFWCQQFNISRWLALQGAGGLPGELQVARVRPVAPATTDLSSVRDELAFFEQLSSLNANVIPLVPFNTRQQVLDSLENEKDLSIMHFACHGAFDATLPDEAAIKLSDASLRPSDIHIKLDKQGRRPLIFINACHTGKVGIGFSGLGGWAERMVKSGVGAFVGAMWEVNDNLGFQFAETFYTSLLQDNMTIAESFSKAREKIRHDYPYNSTWLAYTLYSHPKGRVKT